MLFSIIPIAFITFAVWPDVDTPAVFFVIDVLTIVAAAIRPGVNASIMELIFPPGALIASTIRPNVNSVAIDLVIAPFTIIVGPIDPLVHAPTMFLPTVKVAFIDAAVCQGFSANALLYIVSPLARIALACLVLVHSMAVSFIGPEVSIEDVAVSVIKSAFAICLAVPPITNVLGAV